jgi:hypothetical protein
MEQLHKRQAKSSSKPLLPYETILGMKEMAPNTLASKSLSVGSAAVKHSSVRPTSHNVAFDLVRLLGCLLAHIRGKSKKKKLLL